MAIKFMQEYYRRYPVKKCVVRNCVIKRQKMSINFNPNISLKPASAVELGSIKNIPSKEIPKNKGAETEVQNTDPSVHFNPITPDIMTAVELATRASIIMAQEYGMPYEIAMSQDIAEDCYNKALYLAEKICSSVDEITLLYENGPKTLPDGTFAIDIYPGDKDGEEIMIEYDEDGFVTRQSRFQDGILQQVEEFRTDGKKNIISLADGKLQEYKEGYEETEDDPESGAKTGKTMEKYFTFNDGAPSMYFEGYADFKDGSSESTKWLWFNNEGKMDAYYEDMKSDAKGNSTVGLHLRYNNSNELCLYIEDILDGTPQGKHYELIGNKWTDMNEKTAKEK